jgi:hypothetical protein
MILPISTSKVAGIAGLNHCTCRNGFLIFGRTLLRNSKDKHPEKQKTTSNSRRGARGRS